MERLKMKAEKIFHVIFLIFFLNGFECGKNPQGLKLLNFTTNFYKLIAECELDNNFVISPASFALATGLVLHGASGETRRQIENALGDSRQLQTLSSQIKNDKTIESVNKIFVSQNFLMIKKYQQKMRRIFGANAGKVDFSAREETAAKINEFISNKTHGLIKDLIKPDILDADTVAMLINAIHFKGSWTHKFKNSQRISDFFKSSDKKIKAKFMTVENEFLTGYNEDLDVEVIELPYEGSNVSMVILLPIEKEGIIALEENLTVEKLKKVLDAKNLRMQKIRVTIPKFKIEYEKSLNEIAKKLGMNKMFESNAELNLMVKSSNLSVDKILQKTIIDVNENGTEAASVTAYQISARMSPSTFTADHPFLFLIKNKNFVFFIGRVAKPNYE